MAFPAGPYTDGQSHTEGDFEYIYDAAKGVWDKVAEQAAAPYDQMWLDPVTNILGLGYSETAEPSVTADLSGLYSTLEDNGDGTYRYSNGTEVDTRIAVSALPSPGPFLYDGKIVEFNTKFFKWYATPGVWAQVG